MAFRCRTLTRWRLMLVLVLLGILTLGTGLHDRASVVVSRPGAVNDGRSEEDVILTLRRAVQSPGESAYKGKTLPAGTIIVVYQEYGDEPHTIDRQGYASRDALVDQIVGTATGTGQRGLGSQVRVDTLNGLGQSRERYAGTAPRGSGVSPSTFITYVTARLPNGDLYESYVNAGRDGYMPGFDAVWSGRMTMGPVPEKAVDAVYRLFESVLFPVDLPEVASSALAAMSGGLSRVSGSASTQRSESNRDRREEATVASRPRPDERTSSSGTSDNLQRPKQTQRQQNSSAEPPFVGPSDSTPTDRAEDSADEVRESYAIPVEIDAHEIRQSPETDVHSVPRVEGVVPMSDRVPRESTAGVSGWWVLFVGMLMGMVGVAVGVKYREQILRLPERILPQLTKAAQDEEPTTDLVPPSQKLMTPRFHPPFTDKAPEFNFDDSFWDVPGETRSESTDGENSDDLRFQENR